MKNIDKIILEEMDRNKSSTLPQIICSIRKNNNFLEGEIRRGVWSLIDRGILILSRDRRIERS